MSFLPPPSPLGFPGLPGQPGLTVPSSPPPELIPQQSAVSPFAVGPGAIAGCLSSVAGFQWNGRLWVYTGLSLQSLLLNEHEKRATLIRG
ncbi:MAG TPA: hypothetical protein DEA91_13780 [Paenibacillus sp.]|nr:hypothetical protein [Paenibacillus sp.]